MKQLILSFLLLISVNAISQDSTQIYSYGGKKLNVSSKYDCSKKYVLDSDDFGIANLKLPKLLYKMSNKDDMNEEIDEGIEEEFNVHEKRKIEFKTFDQKFIGYLYKLEKDGKIRFMISSFGIIENATYLTLIIKNENLDLNNFKLPPELIELINITELQ